MERRHFVAGALATTIGERAATEAADDEPTHVLESTAGNDVIIYDNPYEGVDWSSDGRYKADHHVHWRGFGDEPADALDVLTDGAEVEGGSLDDDQLYEVLGAGSQAEDEEPYWGSDEGGWEDMNIRDDDWQTRDPEDLGLDGVISFPSQEIDDVEHICHLFAVSSPQDYEYYPGSGGSTGNYDDFSEALPEVIEDVDNTIVCGRGQVVIPHPSRYMSSVDDWDRYLPFFEGYGLDDGLLGLEIYQKGLGEQGNHYGDGLDLEDMFSMWDSLLSETMPERPIWGFSANDCNFGEWGHGAGPDLRWWTVLLSDDEFDPSCQHESRLALFDALEEGRFYITMRDRYDQCDPADAPEPPQVTSMDISAAEITIDVDWPDEIGTIDWYRNGEVVETGETIELEESHIPYVRAHIYRSDSTGSGNPDGQIATQPIALVADGYELPGDLRDLVDRHPPTTSMR